MSTTGQNRVDVAALRAAHPIEQVIAACGVQLHPRGRGYMGCCPFHDDTTASMSVGGVPERFKCFGCGAGGDVIEFVARTHQLSFTDAVNALQQGTFTMTGTISAPRTLTRPGTVSGPGAPTVRRLHLVPPAPAPAPATPPVSAPPRPAVEPDRAYDINTLAWQHFSTPAATAFASNYLRQHRGLDLTALQAQNPTAALVGRAGPGWTTLTDRLRANGVSDDELLATDLATTTKAGRVIDTMRNRLIFPVADPAGRIGGFIGRDITGDPRAPKYRNPTGTPTFDKSAALYRPTHQPLDTDASVVVVEGVLDALAIAAAAARLGHMGRFAPCTTSGVTVSDAQVEAVLNLHERPVVIALDGDTAGAEGTNRWLAKICLQRGRLAVTTRLPANLDPAEWRTQQGDSALTEFDRCHCLDPHAAHLVPHLPGRELVRLALTGGRDPVHQAVNAVLPLATKLPSRAGIELLNQAESEITRQGWNPNGIFRQSVRDTVLSIMTERLTHTPSPTRAQPPQGTVHRFPDSPSPTAG